jgi:hypothetical protein
VHGVDAGREDRGMSSVRMPPPAMISTSPRRDQARSIDTVDGARRTAGGQHRSTPTAAASSTATGSDVASIARWNTSVAAPAASRHRRTASRSACPSGRSAPTTTPRRRPRPPRDVRRDEVDLVAS